MYQGKQLFNSAVVDQKVDTAVDFDCINLTIKFQKWSQSDAWCNQKNLVAVLKELNLVWKQTSTGSEG